MTERRLYFSHPSTFNDPLDCNLSTAEPYKRMLREVRVFCMSGEKRDDFLMFAHYGDSHRGFRLTFEIDTDDKTLNEIGVLGRGKYVTYSQYLPSFDENDIHKSLLTKAASWSYEAEYRIFSVNHETMHYDKAALVEIAFGYRFNPDFEPVIRNWITCGEHEKTIFLRAIPSTDLIGFVYVKV
ncbi:MAG: DUF2971 domain-containing protein [Pseudomonadota bacterium]